MTQGQEQSLLLPRDVEGAVMERGWTRERARGMAKLMRGPFSEVTGARDPRLMLCRARGAFAKCSRLRSGVCVCVCEREREREREREIERERERVLEAWREARRKRKGQQRVIKGL